MDALKWKVTDQRECCTDPGVGALGGQQPLSLTAPWFLERGGPGSRAGRNTGQERGWVHMLLSQVASALFDGPLGPEELCHMAAQATQQCCKG